MADFETREVNPAALFDGEHFYKVPSYQRPFSWDFDDFDDLIGDTVVANRDQNYFLGTIVFHMASDGVREVVDGQQRLTSLMILLACLRDTLIDPDDKQEMQDFIAQKQKKIKGIPARVRLEVKDREIYNKIVVEEGGTNKLPDIIGLTEPQKRYVYACEAFRTRLDKMNDVERSAYATFISNRCQFIYLSATTFEEAFRLFEVVNDRGKQLRRIDVLKAHNVSPKYITSETARQKVSLDWERAEDDVGETVFEQIFFLMRLALVKDKPKGDLLSEFQDRVFEAKLVEPGEKFVDLVLKYVELYRSLFIDRSALDGTPEEAKFQSLIYIMDNEFHASEWRSCMMLFLQKFKKANLYNFCLEIEKLFLTHSVNGTRKDERYTDYKRILQLIDASSDSDAVVKQVGGNEGAVVAAVQAQNFYGRDFTKYVLLKLELTASDFDKPHFYDARSIEHVFPQTPKPGGAWDGKCDAATREQHVDKIGNLVLMSKSKNSSASNKEFDEKKSSYLLPRVNAYPRSMQVLSYTDWGPSEIDIRTAEAAATLFSPL